MSLCLKSQRNMTRFVFFTAVIALVATTANGQQMMTFSEIAAKHNLKAPTLPPADVLFDSNGKVTTPIPPAAPKPAAPAPVAKPPTAPKQEPISPLAELLQNLPAEQQKPNPVPVQHSPQQGIPPQQPGFPSQQYPTQYQPYGQPAYGPNPYQQPYGQSPYNPNPFHPYGQPQPYTPYQPYGFPQPSPYGSPYGQQPQPNPYQQSPYGQYPQPNPYQQVPYGYPQPQPNPYQPQPNPYQPQPNPYEPHPNPYQQRPHQPQPNPYEQRPPQSQPNPNEQRPPQPQPNPYEERPPQPNHNEQRPPQPQPNPYDQRPPQPQPNPYEQRHPQPQSNTNAQYPPQSQPNHNEQRPPQPQPNPYEQRPSQAQPNPYEQRPSQAQPKPYEERPPQPNPNQQRPPQPQPNPYEQRPPQPQPNPYEQRHPQPQSNTNAQYPPQSQPNPNEQRPPQPQPNLYEQRPSQAQPNPYEQRPSQAQPNPYEQRPPQPQPNPYEQSPPQPQPNSNEQRPLMPQPNPYEQRPPQPQPNPYEQRPPQPQPPRREDQIPQEQGGQRPQPTQVGQHQGQPQNPQNGTPSYPQGQRPQPQQTHQGQQSQHQNGQTQDPNMRPQVQDTSRRYAMPAQPEQPMPQGVQTYTKADGCSYQCDLAVRDPVCGVLIEGPGGHDYPNQCMFEGEHKCFPGTYSGFRRGSCNARFERIPAPQLPPKKIAGPNGCEFECVPVVRPVCAVRDNDIRGKTFNNACELDGFLKCTPEMQKQINLVLTGDCKDIPASHKVPLAQRNQNNAAFWEDKQAEQCERRMCGMIFDPVCGVREDGQVQEFSNQCEYNNHVACNPKSFTRSVKGGCDQVNVANNADNKAQCEPKMCTMMFDPVCGVRDDGQVQEFSNQCQYENHVACNPKSFARSVKGGCDQVNVANNADNKAQCEPKMCTMMFDPVCGVREDGQLQEFSNQCQYENHVACNPKSFRGSVKGVCDQDNAANNADNEAQCEPMMCAMMFDPVCGVREDGQLQEFSNQCQYDNHVACNPKSFTRSVKGGCDQVNVANNADNEAQCEPKMCTMMFDPVCGVREDGQVQEFSNQCQYDNHVACNPKSFTRSVKGGCDQVNVANNADNEAQCEPKMCTMMFDPVCGVREDGQVQEFSNQCQYDNHVACNPKSFTRSVKGGCVQHH